MRLHSAAFAADPHHHYDQLKREHGALAPVEVADEVPASLVLDYRTALHVLNDADHFPADPRAWQSTVPEQCPVLPMMEWTPVAGKHDAGQHVRYRSAYNAALGDIDLFRLRTSVEAIAVPLINGFCETGAADLLGDYAVPLTLRVINDLMGFSPGAGQRLAAAMSGLEESADAATADTHDRRFRAAIAEIVAAKRAIPGGDLISALVHDPVELDDAEIVALAAVLYARGTAPTWNLIANTLLRMTTDQFFRDMLLGGSVSTRDAIEEVLFRDPPLANSCVRFPRQPQIVGDVWLPVDQPVIISSTACNNDSELTGDRTGNRSHLAWGAGPRACPAQAVAMVIAQEALDQLLDALPDIVLAVPPDEIRWRPSAFHRAPYAVPVNFAPAPPLPGSRAG